MGTLLLAVFDDEARARAAAQELRALHAAGAVTLYAFAIVARERRGGGLSVREPMAKGLGSAAPVLGAAIGALVSLLGGPATAVTRTVDAGLVRAVCDLIQAGLGAGFLDQAARHLRAGSAAIVAEIEEESPLPLDARVMAFGGRILRYGHGAAAPEELAMREIAALQRTMASLRRAERGGAEHRHAAPAVRRTRATELRQTLRRAQSLADALRREAVAKVMVLRAQAACLDGDARAAVERRAAAVRTEIAARASRLDRLVEDLTLPSPRRPGSDRVRRGPGGEF